MDSQFYMEYTITFSQNHFHASRYRTTNLELNEKNLLGILTGSLAMIFRI